MDDNDVNLATTSKFSANEDATKNNCSIKYSNNDGTVPSTRLLFKCCIVLVVVLRMIALL